LTVVAGIVVVAGLVVAGVVVVVAGGLVVGARVTLAGLIVPETLVIGCALADAGIGKVGVELVFELICL
jgi:hypothetical protein